MLAETAASMDSSYWYVGWAVGIVFGIVAYSVYHSKGYTSEAVTGLIGGFVCLPIGLLAMIQAFSAKSKHDEALRAKVAKLEAQRGQLAPGFATCPRCAAQNGEAQGACWQCGLPFPGVAPTPPPPPPTAAPPKSRPRDQREVPNFKRAK